MYRVRGFIHILLQLHYYYDSHIYNFYRNRYTDSRDAAVVRALASHQCGLGSIIILARCHMWVEYVVSSQKPNCLNERIWLNELSRGEGESNQKNRL